jgi:hypothetical protein
MAEAPSFARLFDKPPAPALPEWERRLLEQARVLRLSQSKAKLVIEFDGDTLLMFMATPQGKTK